MPILSGQTSFTGLSGIQPNLVFIDTSDTIATVTTAGYLNHAVQEGMLTLQNGYMALVNTKVNQNPHTPRVPIWLQVSITGTAPNLVYSLVEPTNGGGVIFPGNVQAGSNGIPGAFISYPPTVLSGRLVIGASDNAANYDVSVTNASFGQTTAFTIPDPGSAAANFLVSGAAFTNGHLIRAAGVGGATIDAGFGLIAATTAAYAGGGTSNAFVAAGLTAASIVTATILASTNSVSITKAVPSANTLTVTFSADPGAATTVSYHAFTA